VFPGRYELKFDILYKRNLVFKGLTGVEEVTPTALVYNFVSSSVSTSEVWAYSGSVLNGSKYSAEDARLKVWCACGSTSKSGLTPTLEDTAFMYEVLLFVYILGHFSVGPKHQE
jgi:hypothetical protein